MGNNSVLGKILITLTGIPQYWGLLLDVIEKMSGEDFARELAKFARREPCWVKGVARSITRLISGSQSIIIGATSGAKIITSATDTFTWGINPDFRNWGLDVPSEPKPNTPVEVHEMVQDGSFKTIFGSLGRDLDDLCLTQEQIIVFVRDHKKWLRNDGYATFFLFEVAGEFFVACVGLGAGEGPRAVVFRFSCGLVWGGDRRHRIVVPLTLEP